MQSGHCLNCGHLVEGSYCSNCGQAAKVGRYDWRYFVKTVLDSFDLDRGLLRACYEILCKPGRAIRDYLDGHRVDFYNPFKFFLITGALSTYLVFHFGLYGESTGEAGIMEWLGFEQGEAFSYYSSKYLTYFSILAIPTFTLVSWLMFYYSGRNLVENFVMNIYAGAGQFFITCLFAPIVIYAPVPTLGLIYGILNIVYNIWVLSIFFVATTIKGVLRAFITVMVSYILMLFVNYFLFTLTPQSFWDYLDKMVG